MASAAIPPESYERDASGELAAEKGLGIDGRATSPMEAAPEDHELPKLADEAYGEYLADPATYTLEEVIKMNGDEDLLGDA